MKVSGQIWRDRAWVWVPALVFFVANFAVLSTYRLRYAGQVQSLDDRLREQVQSRKESDRQRENLQAMLSRLRSNDASVRQLYDDRFSTRRRRLTAITGEVKEMAAKAGLRPGAINYPEEEIQDYGLIKRSFVFSVRGNYPQLRNLIQMLELSHSFLTLEEANVQSDTDSPDLRIDLTLSTLFAKDPADQSAPAGSGNAAGAPATGGGR